MHLRVLSAITALATTCHSLPLEPRAASPNALAPRPTYAVVPIDGGASQGGTSGSGSGSGSGDVAITVVTTVTSPPTTKRPDAPTGVPIVDIEQQPKTTTKVVYVEQTTSVTSATTSTTSTSSSTPSLQTTAAQTTDATSSLSTATVQPTTTMPTASAASSTTPAVSAITTPQAVLPTTSTASTSTTYDDGMWHTAYPPWNGTMLNRRASRPRLW
ncbi:hypothetical protein B0T14DRAFT_231456 [Immersiella caudata]|uniref:Uncharacterized protein n=1 Tax=Immersiella caudata TaxID=314043 RepID=A0AA39WS84_9PEZI|nr:hypothetical protein B0T14DRAFT_231456 [Immersiella caudata]